MAVVEGLPDECDCGLRVLWVQFGHVEVVHEVDEVHVAPDRFVGLALFLQTGLKLQLQAEGVSVLVEVYYLLSEFGRFESLQHTLDQLRLA